MKWTLPRAEGKLGALQSALGNLLLFTKVGVYAAGWVTLSRDMFTFDNDISEDVGWVTALFLLYLVLCWLASSACSILHRIIVGPVPEKWKMLTRGVGLSMLMFWLSVKCARLNFLACGAPWCDPWWISLY